MLQKLQHNEAMRLVLSLFSCVLYAVGINWFIVPLGLYSGGLLGVCQLLRTFLIEVLRFPDVVDYSGIFYMLFNIPIFFLAWRMMGKGFLLRSVVCTLATSFLLSVIRTPETPIITESLAACVVGGIIAGFALGLCLTCGSSTGGLDIVGLWMAKSGKSAGVGRFSLAINVFVYAVCAYLFGLGAAVYSMIFTVFCALFLDRFHEQNVAVQVMIFTKGDSKQLLEPILNTLERGVTTWEGKGGYTDEPIHILCVCVSKFEVEELQNAIRKVDPNAFFILQEGIHVGGYFEKKF